MKRIVFLVAVFFMFAALSGLAFADADSDYETGLKYYNSGKFEEAIEYFENYIDEKPEAGAYYRLGYALYKTGKHNEAIRHFEEAYFIDPDFTPGPYVPENDDHPVDVSMTESGELKITAPDVTVPSDEPVMQGEEAALREAFTKAKAEGELPEGVLEMPAGTTEETEQPAAGGYGEPAPPAGGYGEPVPHPTESDFPSTGGYGEPVHPPAEFDFPSTGGDGEPFPLDEMPEISAGWWAAMAGFMIFFYVLALALYLFIALCYYKIATKLNVPAAWLAWIPIAQIWPVVGSAGKPWWWILLLFIPLVGAFIGIYLWMCIAENLGKNKWMGLIILVPIINLAFLGYLAFSEAES
ncbi:MAG TPA: tetratricopeptide repeat protein [Nitrospirae bacterium]|nr:tetratricopeptide repeat protein [Nitrospirota bacterium]